MNWVIEQLDSKELKLGEITESETLKENFKMNAIPQSLFSMDIVDYENFLVERRKLMADKIKEYYSRL